MSKHGWRRETLCWGRVELGRPGGLQSDRRDEGPAGRGEDGAVPGPGPADPDGEESPEHCQVAGGETRHPVLDCIDLVTSGDSHGYNSHYSVYQ